MAEGFLGRWSQRKQAVREGKALAELPKMRVTKTVPELVSPVVQAPIPPATPPPPPPLSMEDVQQLTTASDFKPFAARNVAPEIRNAAMKKLFSDPRYNVMDCLDTYIDDYSKADPVPESMLRKMVSAKFLKLFDDEKTREAPLRDDSHNPSVNSVAQSGQSPQSGIEPFIESTSNDKTAMMELAAKSGSGLLGSEPKFAKPSACPTGAPRRVAEWTWGFAKLRSDPKNPRWQDRTPCPELGSDPNSAKSTQPPAAGADPSAKNKPQLMGPNHDHIDLQLQPNHAAGRLEPGRGAE